MNDDNCRWKTVAAELLSGAGTERHVRRSLATEFVRCERLSERITPLARQGLRGR